MAAIWNLPIIFICENNKFSENTDTSRMFRGPITRRAEAYGITARSVDGYDPIALYGAYGEALDRARSGGGATFIEAECFRYYGHYFGDPMQSVPPDQLEAEKRRHALPNFTEQLVASGVFTRAELDEIRKGHEEQAKATVDANVAAAPVSSERMFERTYANPIKVD